MRRFRKKCSMVLAAGILFQLEGTCLPENYFALTFRQVFVSLADAAVNSAISDISDQLGLTPPVVDGTATTTTTDTNTTP